MQYVRCHSYTADTDSFQQKNRQTRQVPIKPIKTTQAKYLNERLNVIYKYFSRDGDTGTGIASGTLIGLVTGMVAKIPSLAERRLRLKMVSDPLLANMTPNQHEHFLVLSYNLHR